MTCFTELCSLLYPAISKQKEGEFTVTVPHEDPHVLSILGSRVEWVVEGLKQPINLQPLL